MNLRTARIGNLRLVASPIPAGSELVRVHVGDDPRYERMIVVTPEADGLLHLAGWIGAPLTPAEWSAAREALFPDARVVRFERLGGTGFSERALRMESSRGGCPGGNP